MQYVSQHAFEQRVRDVHNHLYANANIRTNEAIATEVAKILLSLMHASGRGIGAVTVLDRREIVLAVKGDPSTVERLAKEVQVLFEDMNVALKRYPDGTEIELDSSSVAYVRAQFDGVLFAEVERDWLGDAMEVFRSLDAKRLGGQFFTDQRVTNLSIDLLEFDPSNGDDFVDICAGTGGFLLAAARSASAARLDDSADSATPPKIRGLEIDAALQRVANGSLVTLLPQEEYVMNADSLADPLQWDVAVRRQIVPGTHRCLASNPPFGTKITIKDDAILGQFDLSLRWSKKSGQWIPMKGDRSARPPDLLFIERNLALAEPGKGRVAIVTPYQVLSGPQLGYVREWILRNALIRAVIDLPVETFQPWTGTKTSLLVLQRRTEPLAHWDPTHDPYDIFMAVAEQIGHDRRGHPVVGTDGVVVTDLPGIGMAFRAFRSGKPFDSIHPGSFTISSTAICSESDQRINASYYMPATSELRSSVASISTMSNWKLTTIGELSERIFYPTRFKREYVSPGEDAVPFYGGSQISQLIPTSSKYLARSSRNIEELLVRSGWILITRSGSTGVVSSVPRSWDGVAMSEHVIRIVPKAGTVEPAYIEAYLRSSVGQDLIASGIFGSVIDEITPEHIAELPIPVPSSKKAMEDICRPFREASEARDVAICGITKSVQSIDKSISSLLLAASS
jgi:type I restriction-modification system DNA methylase subunit